jgi:phage terminase small subunit
MNIITKTIHKACDIGQGIMMGCVGCELVYQCNELLDVVRDGSGLIDVEQLAQKQLVLTTAKSLMNQHREIHP